MRERWIILLSLTAVFNLLFWLLIFNGYTLKGNLVDLPATAVVGSIAIVLLSALIARVRQPTSRPSVAFTRSPRKARFKLLFLPLWSWAMVILSLFCSLFVFWLILGLVSKWAPISRGQDATKISVVIGSVLIIISSCTAIVFFFNWVATLINQAALPKSVELFSSTLQGIPLVLVFIFVGTILLSKGGDVYCSKHYLSPSGQRSVLVEDQEISFARTDVSRAYLDWLIFRKDLGTYYPSSICRNNRLMLKWSADERQVDWKILGGTSNEQGSWQF